MLAKAIAASLTGVVVLMAAFFADRRNAVDAEPGPGPPPVPAVAPASSLDPTLVARGRTVYEEQSCARCHSVEGGGNPRSPLDGVGARRTETELRAWVTGSGAARDLLTRSALRTKDDFGELPEPELQALVAYLRSLR